MGNEVEISKKFRCEDLYSEINELLKNIIEIHAESKTEKGYSFDYDVYSDYESLIEILLNILYEKSNIKSIIKEKKNSLDINTLGKAFKNLEHYKNDKNLHKRFFDELNLLLNNSIIKFSFIFPLNISFFGENYEKDLKNVLNLFNLEMVNLDEIRKILDAQLPEKSYKSDNNSFKEDRPTNEDILKYLSSFHTVLYTQVNARSLYYADNEAKFKVKSFLGLLSYANNYLQETEYLGYTEDFSINKLNYEYFIAISNKGIFWPVLTLETLESKPTELFKEREFNFLKIIYKELEKIKSESLMKILKNSFYNYFEASTEKTLNYSFLKFWIITEDLIKSVSLKTDDEVKEIIKSLLSEEILRRRVDFLHKTRNNLVHAGKEASISDKNLAKIIADLILSDAIIKMSKLNNKKQFDYYLSNVKTKKKNRKELSKVLELLNKNEI